MCKEKHFKACNAKNNNRTFNKRHAQPQPVHAASFLGVPDSVLEDDSGEGESHSPPVSVGGHVGNSKTNADSVKKARYLHCQILL